MEVQPKSDDTLLDKKGWRRCQCDFPDENVECRAEFYPIQVWIIFDNITNKLRWEHVADIRVSSRVVEDDENVTWDFGSNLTESYDLGFNKFIKYDARLQRCELLECFRPSNGAVHENCKSGAVEVSVEVTFWKKQRGVFIYNPYNELGDAFSDIIATSSIKMEFFYYDEGIGEYKNSSFEEIPEFGVSW